MKIFTTMMVLLFSVHAVAECVHEQFLTLQEIRQLPHEQNSFIEVKQRFIPLKDFQKLTVASGKYLVQTFHPNQLAHHQEGSRSSYNRNYLEYYEYEHLLKYLKRIDPQLKSKGYRTQMIGFSVGGRNLYAIAPRKIDLNKKTILMFGRHHGDEGTANWIIEGFLDRFLAQDQEYQLILYPMVNPDGAANQKRYNANGRDLNRVWGKSASSSKDEVQTIHQHLEPWLKGLTNTVVVLDMHGSFTEDFIYRVDRRFKSQQFHQHQEDFIQQLGKYDPFQNGNYQTSNGHPKMSRIMLINQYGLNAMTHESIRDIRKGKSRTIATLKAQGEAIVQTVHDLY